MAKILKKLAEIDRACPGAILYYGEPGTGKTFNAFNFTRPTVIIDFDQRASTVYDVLNINDEDVLVHSPRNWKELVLVIKEFASLTTSVKSKIPYEGCKEQYAKPTLVIDSITTLVQFAQDEYARKNPSQIEPTIMWTEVSSMIDEVMFILRSLNAIIVATAQMKDEFASGRTGERIIDCYKRVPFWADVVIRCETVFSEDGSFKGFSRIIKKNGLGECQSGHVDVGLKGIQQMDERWQ